MSRLILYLARTLEPPGVDTPVEVYGMEPDPTPQQGVVVDVDEDRRGITVQLTTAAYGCQTWHFDLPQVK